MGVIDLQVQLNKFKRRPYQEEVFDAINRGFKKILLCWARRSGKDCTAFNVLIREAIKRPALYLYMLPSYSQGRRVIWDGLLSSGQKMLSFVPDEIISNINNSEMKITLVNNSIIQVCGSDTAAQSLVGTNPAGCVFSEWSRSEPSSYTFIRPALLYNNGFAIFISTPWGRNNHMYEMHQVAKRSSEWFESTKTIDDTGHLTPEEIERERDTMSEDMIRQEYYCDYDAGSIGSFYDKYINKMRLENRICQVPYEAALKVNVCFDLGWTDSTVMIFYQMAGLGVVRIIDYYESTDNSLAHYAQILKQKPYLYGDFFFPHDIAVHELGTGLSRLETVRRLGIRPARVLPNLEIEDGIEQVKLSMSKWWIDEERCAPLIRALEEYRREWDIKNKTYKSNPLHNWASHAADCARYLALSLPKCSDSLTTADELDKRYTETRYGSQSHLPPVFRDDIPHY